MHSLYERLSSGLFASIQSHGPRGCGPVLTIWPHHPAPYLSEAWGSRGGGGSMQTGGINCFCRSEIPVVITMNFCSISEQSAERYYFLITL